jgi:hypothetical protein
MAPPPVTAVALVFIPMLLLIPPLVVELFPFAAELFSTTEPAPKRLGCLREFKIYCVFIALV